MINKLSYLLLAVLFLTTFDANSWSQNGHRIIGKIADNHLTPDTRQALTVLLAQDSLAEVATWADEMRSNPAVFWQKQSPKWHYINLNSANDFNPAKYQLSANTNKDEVTDIYSAILKAVLVLRSKQSTNAEKRFYLRFLTHLVGDIHQPLHAGRSEDWGGNKIDVTFFGKKTNLHSVWDKELVESENLSYSEFVEFIDTNNQTVITQYLASSPKDWVLESFHIAKRLYEIDSSEFKYNYLYQQMPVVKTQLLKGGIRLAGLLNFIFDKSAQVQVNAVNYLEQDNKQ